MKSDWIFGGDAEPEVPFATLILSNHQRIPDIAILGVFMAYLPRIRVTQNEFKDSRAERDYGRESKLGTLQKLRVHSESGEELKHGTYPASLCCSTNTHALSPVLQLSLRRGMLDLR